MSPTPEQLDALIVEAVCCRVWPVLATCRLGRCGYCGAQPTVRP